MLEVVAAASFVSDSFAINAALFAFMNRIVDGLGGALEDDMRKAAVALGLPLHPGTFEHLEP